MLKINDKIKTYYGNGSFVGVVSVVKMTDKSVFVAPVRDGIVVESAARREGINSVNRYLAKGLWKPID